jgi:hypothetical protein
MSVDLFQLLQLMAMDSKVTFPMEGGDENCGNPEKENIDLLQY